TNLQTSQAGSYTVFIANSVGSVSSSAATLTVLVPPAIINPPQSQGVVRGQSTTFTVDAQGTSPLRYQWRFNGNNLAGATNAALALTNVLPTQAGNYAVVVNNSVGGTTSAVATLTVYVPAGISMQPLTQTGTQGLSKVL